MQFPQQVCWLSCHRRYGLLQFFVSLGLYSSPRFKGWSRRVSLHRRPSACQLTHCKAPVPYAHLKQELMRTAGFRYCALLNLPHCYWQHTLHQASQACQSFLAPGRVYTPTRILHGTENAVIFLQSTLAAYTPDELRRQTLWWLSNIFIFSKTIMDRVDSICSFLQFCFDNGFRLHPGKCILYATSVRRCNRLIEQDGISFDLDVLAVFAIWHVPALGLSSSNLFSQ